jgi:inner membrane protein
VFYGAVVAALPDLDILFSQGDTFRMWYFHRGPSHSFFFDLVAGTVLGAIFALDHKRWVKRRLAKGKPVCCDNAEKPFWFYAKQFILLGILVLLSHTLLDVITSYGTVAFWPFSNMRIALNFMPIIDIIYTSVLLIAVIANLFKYNKLLRRFTLAFAIIYPVFAWGIGEYAKVIAAKDLKDYEYSEINAHSLPGTPFLRRIVVKNNDDYKVTFFYLFGANDKLEWFDFKSDQSSILAKFKSYKKAKLFNWFAMDNVYWKQKTLGDKTIIEAWDIRYGYSQSNIEGFWGITGRVDKDGKLIGEITTLRGK